MSILNVSRLELDLSDPRDRRIHERIETELTPVAESILEEHRAGYTEEEIKELARQRSKRREWRQKAREKAQASSAEQTESVREELSDRHKVVLKRLWELTSEGPVRRREIAALLRSEGIGWSEVYAVRQDDRLRFDESGGAVYISRAAA